MSIAWTYSKSVVVVVDFGPWSSVLTLHELLSSLFLLFNLKEAEMVSEPKQLFVCNVDWHYYENMPRG